MAVGVSSFLLDGIRAVCNADLRVHRFGYPACVAPRCSCCSLREDIFRAAIDSGTDGRALILSLPRITPERPPEREYDSDVQL